jgi:hypothetical protein
VTGQHSTVGCRTGERRALQSAGPSGTEEGVLRRQAPAVGPGHTRAEAPGQDASALDVAALVRRLVPQGRVIAYPYKGYWSPADTVKERAQLDEMYHQGNCPWMIWDLERAGSTVPVGSALSEIAAGRNPVTAFTAEPQ